MSDERPRWSFTWLLRLQRTGRPKATDPDHGALWRGILWVVVGGLLLVEVWLGLLLGVLPR